MIQSSEKREARYGVPQGSKLPILFLLYTNEINNIFKNSTSIAYADDTTIVLSHKNVTTATKIMQKELDMLIKWTHEKQN